MPQKTSLCIFGATGFTGKRVAFEIATQIQIFHQGGKTPFTWSIAGRSSSSLEKIRDEIKTLIGASTANGSDRVNIQKGLLPSLVEANVNDHNSLRSMAKNTKLVLNCVGPYAHLGESVVKAVLEASQDNKDDPTHYIDLSGEPNFIERMVLNHRSRAKALGCIIIPASAYDSVPADMGTLFAKSQLQHLGQNVVPASVEMILQIKSEGKGVAGHYATYASAINGFSPEGRRILSSTRKQLYGSLPKIVPVPKEEGLSLGIPKRKKVINGLFTFDEETQSYLLPFPFADPAVVRLSQALIADEEKANSQSIQFVGWIALPSLTILFWMAIYFLVFSFMCKYTLGRRLLLAHPKLFTGGVFSHEGPTVEQLKGTSVDLTITGRGYSKKAFESGTAKEPDVKAVIKIRAPEPGYVATPILFVAVARVILQEESKIHRGVSVPAAALRDTSLIKNLNEDGRVTFRSVS